MVATKTPNKNSTPARAKSAPVKTPAEPKAPAVAKASPPVSEAPDLKTALEAAPVVEPEAALEPTPEPVATVAVEPAPEPVVASEPEPEPEQEDAGVAVDEDVEQLASLAEQVIYEAEAMAGEAAHNFQVALKAATGAQGVVPTLNGINSYLHRSVQINSQFVEQFATVRSPVCVVISSDAPRTPGTPPGPARARRAGRS